MAPEHATVAHTPISGDDLVFLLDDLRLQRRFSIGIDEHLIAQELLANWQHRGSGDPVGLRNWLAPVLCTNPEEQTEFYRRFEVWWTARTATPLEPAPAPPPIGPDRRPHAGRPWFWLGVVLVAAVIAGVLVWNVERPPSTQGAQSSPPAASTPPAGSPQGSARPETSSPPSTAPAGPPRGSARAEPAVPPSVAASDQLTVAVTVVDAGNRGIPMASVCLARALPRGQTGMPSCVGGSVQTGESGQAELHATAHDQVTIHVSHSAYVSPPPYDITQRTGRVSLRATLAQSAPSWFTWLQRNTLEIQVVAALLPLILAGCWWGWLRSRRQVVLERRASSQRSDQASVSLPAPPRTLFLGDNFVRARVEARRSRAVGSGDLDIDATVERTLGRLGCFSPVYRLRRELPSYLALVDRSSYRDQHSRLFDELLDRLVEGNVPIVRYYFDRDPRVCAPSSGEGEHRTLLELASLHVDHRLLVFTSGTGLTDAVTGRPAGWLDVFSSWSERALMTPVPACHWTSHEIDLAETGFRVLPASAAGLVGFAESLRVPDASPETRDGESWVPPFPAILYERPAGWTERSAPTAESAERLCRQLRRYLGTPNFRWLCSLAVYPELDWHLTLFMGLRLRAENGAPLIGEEALLALTRLPWLRHGSMPDWLRMRLIDELSATDEESVREFLGELLERRLESSWSEFQLAVARPHDGARPGWKRWLVDLLRTEPPGSPLQDRIFVTFVLGRKPDKLQVRAPRTWDRWVYERGVRALGLRAAPIAVLAVALGAAGLATGIALEGLEPVVTPPGESRITPAPGIFVPELVGRPQQDAFEALARTGLAPGTLTQQESDGPSGRVLSQNPAPGAQMARGAAVDLVLSAPRAPVVPTETFPVAVDVMPWARFTVTAVGSNARINPGPYVTPAILELPEGTYDFAFENGGLSGARTLRVPVQRDGQNSVRLNLPGFDVNRAVDAILGLVEP